MDERTGSDEDWGRSQPREARLGPGLRRLSSAAEALLGGRDAEILERRRQVFLEELGAREAQVDASRLDAAFLDSDRFADLFLCALQASLDTGDRDKVRLLVATLVGAALTGAAGAGAARDGEDAADPDDVDPETLLRTLASLASADVRLATEMLRRFASDSWAAENGVRAPEQRHVEFHLQRLLSAGLIATRLHLQGYGWSVEPTRYLPTPALTRLTELLEEARYPVLDEPPPAEPSGS